MFILPDRPIVAPRNGRHTQFDTQTLARLDREVLGTQLSDRKGVYAANCDTLVISVLNLLSVHR